MLRVEILSLFDWKLDRSHGIALGLTRAVNDLRSQLAAETARREAAEKRADELGRERARLYGRLVEARR
jgi:hypothetical protein